MFTASTLLINEENQTVSGTKDKQNTARPLKSACSATLRSRLLLTAVCLFGGSRKVKKHQSYSNFPSAVSRISRTPQHQRKSSTHFVPEHPQAPQARQNQKITQDDSVTSPVFSRTTIEKTQKHTPWSPLATLCYTIAERSLSWRSFEGCSPLTDFKSSGQVSNKRPTAFARRTFEVAPSSHHTVHRLTSCPRSRPAPV